MAVDALDLVVDAGECFGLLGPNGAGKTTTIRLINTLLPLQRGSVRVMGPDVKRRAMAIRRSLGYVPQQLSVEGALTGRENVTPTNLWLDFAVLSGSALAGIYAAAALLGRLAR